MSELRKKTSEVPLPNRTREIILNVRAYFERERDNGGPLIDINKVLQRTADATNIGFSTVKHLANIKLKLNAEEKMSNVKRLRNKPKVRKRGTILNDHAARRIIHLESDGKREDGTSLILSNNGNIVYEDVFIKENSLSDEPEQIDLKTEMVCKLDSNQRFNNACSNLSLPLTEEFAGDLHFELLLDTAAAVKKTWLYSNVLKKVFIDINKQIVIGFKWDFSQSMFDEFFIRALPVYTEDDWSAIPVERCPVHISPEDILNSGFPWVNHVLRCDNSNTVYETDEISKRKSCITPVFDPTPCFDYVALSYKFVCKTSCYRGMQRRPVVVIFTLENADGNVLGRRCLTFKICSCLKRDRQREEDELERSIKFSQRRTNFTTTVVYNDVQSSASV